MRKHFPFFHRFEKWALSSCRRSETQSAQAGRESDSGSVQCWRCFLTCFGFICLFIWGFFSWGGGVILLLWILFCNKLDWCLCVVKRYFDKTFSWRNIQNSSCDLFSLNLSSEIVQNVFLSFSFAQVLLLCLPQSLVRLCSFYPFICPSVSSLPLLFFSSFCTIVSCSVHSLFHLIMQLYYTFFCKGNILLYMCFVCFNIISTLYSSWFICL